MERGKCGVKCVSKRDRLNYLVVRAGLRQGREGPCTGPRASEPLCDTAAFLSSSFHVTARMAKFCSRPVIYCQVPQSAAVNGGLNVGAPVVDNGHGQLNVTKFVGLGDASAS